MIKDLVKKITVGLLAVACVCAMAACTGSDEPDNTKDPQDNNQTNTPQETLAQQQITLAQNTYNAFYSKDELFSAQSVKALAVSLALEDEEGDEESGISFADVRNVLAEYNWTTQDTKFLFNSYVADIFAYSQVQTSIINEFGEQSLTDVYALTYDNVDWSEDPTGWIYGTKLLSAAFVGADLESGNVYCSQSHRSMGTLVMANLEYYYNNDNDMGVTTLNWHSNGTFEYHFCSAGTFENLEVFGTYDQNGDITLTSFAVYRQNARLMSSVCSTSDKQIVYDYVLSEVARINGKIEDLQEQNGRERNLNGNEDEDADGTEESHIGICSVNFDFSVLSRMLIK